MPSFQDAFCVALVMFQVTVVDQGCGITRGLSPHFCDTRESFPFFVWGAVLGRLFCCITQWSFPTALFWIDSAGMHFLQRAR